MSYLDKPMNRQSYFEHISTKSHSHIVNARIALDWFEKFVIGRFNGRSTDTVLKESMKQKKDDPQRHSVNLFSILQEFINYLGNNNHDPSTIRANFNLVKSYLNWYGFEVFSEGVSSRLNFPRKIFEEPYPLTLEDIQTLLNSSNSHRRVLYLFLTSTGLRISESVQIRKSDLDFSFDRIMVKVKGSYTKTKKPRKTFITKETQKYLMPILEKLKDDDLIFGTNEDRLKSKHTEEDYYYRMRIRAGLSNLKYDNGIHKITLHSFRSWFVTKCNRVDSDFGNALAGHEKYMKRYNRFTDEEKCQLFIKAEKTLSIFERVDEDQENRLEEQSKEIADLKDKVNSLVTLYELSKTSSVV